MPTESSYEVAKSHATVMNLDAPITLSAENYDWDKIKRYAYIAADIGMSLVWFSPISVWEGLKLAREGVKEKEPLLIAAGLIISGMEFVSVGPLDIATKPLERLLNKLVKERGAKYAVEVWRGIWESVLNKADELWKNRAAFHLSDVTADLSRIVEGRMTKVEFNLNKHVLRKTYVTPQGKEIKWPEYLYWEHRFKARVKAGKEGLSESMSIHEFAATPQGREKLKQWYIEEIFEDVNNKKIGIYTLSL